MVELLRLVLNIIKIYALFSCHKKAVTSASAVQPLRFGKQLQNCQSMAVSYSVHGLTSWEKASCLLFLRSSFDTHYLS